MGNCRSGVSSVVAPASCREVTILFLGLDNAGKTTLIANLNGESTEGTTPTIGFSSTNLEVNKFRVKFYDLGGGNRLQNIWKNYFSEVYGCIFVVDASSINRLNEAKEALSKIVQHERMRGKPLLIFANKQDCSTALGEGQISEQLDLDGILGEYRKSTRVVKCTALKSVSNGKSDPVIVKGVKWLLGQLDQHYEQFQERVNADVASQRAMEAQKRKERAERVSKIKEERERQKKLAGVVDETEEETDGGEVTNPFKPIMQTAVETEAKEKAARAQNEEIQERLRALQETSKEYTGESTEPMLEGESSKLEERGEPPYCEGEENQSSSGLSASSDSLTDVTPQSHASSDSIHPSLPPSSHSQKPPPIIDQANKITNGEKKKKKKHSMLLSRLKNRSKIVPMVPSEALPTNPTPHSSESIGTWTAPGLDLVNIQTPATLKQSFSHPSLPSQDSNIPKGFPELPRSRVTLPPITATRQSVVSTADKILHTEEDVTALPLTSIIQLSQPPGVIPTVEPLSS